MKSGYFFVFCLVLLFGFFGMSKSVGAMERDGVSGGSGDVNPPAKAFDFERALGLKFSGDIIFRTEYFVQTQDYAPTYVTTPVLWLDHEFRFRLRGRFGMEKVFGEEATAGLRFSTGNGMDPADPYLTLTNGSNSKSVFLDRLNIVWTPGFFDHQLSLALGKMPNPLAFSPITWDEDISPEGAAITYEPLKDARITALYGLMQENGPATIEGNGVDLFIFNFQFQQKIKVSNADISLTAGYEYVPNVSAYITPGEPGFAVYTAIPSNPPGAPLSITSKGMVGDLSQGGLIPDINMVEGILNISHKVGEEKIPVLWTFHGVFNLTSFNIAPSTNANVAVNNPKLILNNNLALFARVGVGEIVRRGDFAGSFEWGYIEPNAVFSAFSDSDSGVGHNNNTWFKGMVGTGIADGISLSVVQYMDWRVNYDVMGTTASNVVGTTSRAPVLRTQIDLAAKF